MPNLAPAFNNVHPALPISFAVLPGGQTAVQVQLGRTEGVLIVAETVTPGALYTVPANKVFTGVVYIQAAGAGSVTVSAATGGTLASETTTGGAASAGSSPVTVPVTVAGGASGNAISLATTGNPSINTVALVGHVK